MPIYEYQCKKCSKTFDRLLLISQFDEPQICDCGGKTTKLISLCSFVNETSENRPLDCIIGKDAEKRWGIVHERKAKRQKESFKKLKKGEK